jgi:uncharacterized coiled-coil DUF342 family protein
MAETYKVGERYYVPVRVTKVEKASEGDRYPITASFLYTKKKTAFNTFANEPDLLLTAEEVAGLLKTKADAMTVTADSLQKENDELKDKCAEFLKTIGVQSDKIRELQAKIAQLTDANDSIGKNRDALNNEAAVHMTSIHNLQVAVEVLAEKIFEMRCEQDG